MATVSPYTSTVRINTNLEEDEPPGMDLLTSTLQAYRQSYITDLKAELKLFASYYTTNTEPTEGDWTL